MDKNQEKQLNDELQKLLATAGHAATSARIDMLLALFSPEARACHQAVMEVAGFEMVPHLKEPFLAFHRYATETPPDFITKFRMDEKRKDFWYHQLVNGIWGNVQQSFLAVLHHQSRLLSIEGELMKRLKSLGELDATHDLPSR